MQVANPGDFTPVPRLAQVVLERVVYEDATVQTLEQPSCQFGEGRSIGNLGVPNPVDRGRLFRDPARRADERSEPDGLVAIRVEQDERIGGIGSSLRFASRPAC